MSRKFVLLIAFILTAALLVAVSGSVSAGGPGVAPNQEATPTPVYGMNSSGGCPMMSGSSSMTGMSGMSGMSGMGSMSGMSGMGSMSGMSSMGSMSSMSNMPYMDENYVVFSDPTTWVNANPWRLIGWVIFGLVVLAVIAAMGLGVFWLARRILEKRPVKAG